MGDFHPEWFGGNEDAARLVAHLCAVAHTWDDLIDGDVPQVSEDRINRCFELALVDIPGNPFYQQYAAQLLPLIYTGVLGYVTANAMERSGDAHKLEIAHGLRYAVAHVAAFAVSVTNPRDALTSILPEAWLAWMPERFADYAKEHNYVA
jgi:hypothetical protein